MLSPAQATVRELREEFLAEAGAKASVHHSSVLAVYEACELEGHTFYTMERVDGLNLLELAERGKALSVEATLRLAQAAGEGMQYMAALGVPRSPLKASAVLLATDGSPRLQNLALGGLRPATSEAEDVATLGRCLEGVLGEDAPLALRSLLERTAPNHQKTVANWAEFLSGIAQCEAAWARFSSNSAPNPQAPTPVRSKRSPLLWVGLFLGVAAAGGVFYWNRPQTPLVPTQAHIPKGQYLVGSGRRAALESFSIDSSEVSNRQYGRFLDWQRTHPSEANSFDHPDQPARQSHTPAYWKDLFPEVARHRAEQDDPRWELPVTEVSWWDAYAFAHWAGRALPTEDEWEAAGRGPRGLLFPWGDEPDPDRTNVKRLPRPGEVPGSVAVESLQDASAFGVRGLSGNVSEWTSTWKENQGVVAKGGHFNAPLLTLDAASPLPPDTRSPSLGFRTVARKTSRP
jgi:formylglycine-generating enzyme required for sulfatase activity